MYSLSTLHFDETHGARRPVSLKEHLRAEQHVTRAICFCSSILWCQLLMCLCHNALSAMQSYMSVPSLALTYPFAVSA